MIDKVQKIREEVARIQLYTQSEVLKQVLDYIDEVQEEPVSEDLGDYVNELSKQFPEVSFAKLSRIAVRVAKWQKEQMTAKVVTLVVKEFYGEGDEVAWLIRPSKILDKKFNIGDKVKIILIKEE